MMNGAFTWQQCENGLYRNGPLRKVSLRGVGDHGGTSRAATGCSIHIRLDETGATSEPRVALVQPGL